MEMSVNELYEKLLKMKKQNNGKTLNAIDLLELGGNFEWQLKQLENEGKIIRHNDVIESFDVIG